MNLINDAWIPVRRADGSRKTIAPWQLTEGTAENPIVAIASPRPDFDGALVQFLIGLLQTTCTPDENGWWDWREAPPSIGILREAFSRVAHAFDLFGDKGPLFMQERFADLRKAKSHPISYLLIGAATDSTRSQNIDHFQKRIHDGDECLCQKCAAAALFTLQTFAPSGGGGGEGKFTGIRGGGPLNTIVLGGHLWETCWLNVLIGPTFSRQPPTEKLFPWLRVSTFISNKKPVKIVRSDDMDPRHVYWGMPRRILLDFETTNDPRLCRGCGTQIAGVACRKYFDVSGGLTYQEKVGSAKKVSWIYPRHPLSPYNEGDDQRPTAVHPRPGGMGYRHWLGWGGEQH
jgi:CRISPR system Cascade subunit CasA